MPIISKLLISFFQQELLLYIIFVTIGSFSWPDNAAYLRNLKINQMSKSTQRLFVNYLADATNILNVYNSSVSLHISIYTTIVSIVLSCDTRLLKNRSTRYGTSNLHEMYTVIMYQMRVNTCYTLFHALWSNGSLSHCRLSLWSH